jgi:hypothetical protein
MLLLTVATMAAAQNPGLPLSTELNTLYMHANADDTAILYMNTLDLATDGTSFNGGVQSTGPGNGAIGWTFPLATKIDAPVTLDPNGKVLVNIYIGGSTAIGAATIGWRLMSGSTEIAAGPAKETTVLAEYTETTWEVAPTAATIPAGSLDFVIEGTAARTGLFISVGERTEHSTTGRPFGGETRITLPIVSAGESGPVAKIITKTLEGASAKIDESFPEAHSNTYVYSWTTTLSDVDITYGAKIDEGKLKFTVTDGDGKEAIVGTLTGSLTETKAITGLKPGDWEIRVEYTDFAGSFSMDIKQQAGAGTTTGGAPTSGATTTGSPAGNETTTKATVQEAGSKDSPSFGIVIGLLALALVTLRRRR